MLQGKKWLIASALVGSLVMGSEAKAFEPVSLAASVVGGSIFCKIIECKTHNNEIIIIRDKKLERAMLDRLSKLRKDFKWDEEDNCRASIALNMGERFCVNSDGKIYVKRYK